MKITYAPPDEVAQIWDFDLLRLTMGELKAIKKHTGIDGLVELGEGLQKYAPDAVCALVWVLRKRHGEPTLAYADVDFAIGDLTIDNDDEAPPKGDAGEVNSPSTSDASG